MEQFSSPFVKELFQCLGAGELDAAERLFSERELSFQVCSDPQILTFQVILLLKRGKWSDAKDVLDSCCGKNKCPDLINTSLRLSVSVAELTNFPGTIENLDDIVSRSEELLNSLPPEDVSYWSALLWRDLGLYYRISGDGHRAVHYLKRAESHFSQLGIQSEVCRILIDLGNAHHTVGELEEVESYYLKAYSLSKEIHSPLFTSGILNNLGVLSRLKGNLDQSLEYYRRSLKYAEESKSDAQIAAVKNNLGVVYFYKGDYQLALEHYRDALKIREKIGNLKHIASSYDNIGEVYLKLGQIRSAKEFLLRALDLREQIGGIEDIATSYENMGDMYFRRGEMKRAMKFFEHALELRKRQGNDILIARTLHHLGRAYFVMGEFDRSISFHKEELNIRRRSGNRLLISETLFALIWSMSVAGLEERKMYLEEMRSLVDGSEQLIELRAELLNAQELICSPRFTLKSRGYESLRSLLNQGIDESELKVFCFLELVKVLFEELRYSRDPEVLYEIQEYLSLIEETAEQEESYYLLVEGKLLEVKIALLNFNFPEADFALRSALRVAEKYELRNLAIRAQRELDRLTRYRSEWQKLRMRGADLEERITAVGLGTTSPERLMFAPELVLEVNNEVPVLLFVQGAASGVPFFNRKFDEGIKEDEFVIANYLSALNSFGKTAFSTEGNIEHIKQGDYRIILRHVDDFVFIYIFKSDELYPAIFNLNAFIDEVLSLGIDVEMFLTKGLIRSTDIQVLNDLADKIFTGSL